MSVHTFRRRVAAPMATIVVTLILGSLLVGCAPKPAGETGTEIVEASEVGSLLEQPNAVLVDTRPMPEYRERHVSGAVNVSRADIVVLEPFPNMVAPREQIERVLGSRGIDNDSLVIAYDDNNNMDAARLWWTLKAYGHHEVKVVSGGLNALEEERFSVDSSSPEIDETTFNAEPLNEEMIVTAPEIRRYLDEPDPSVVLVDTRSEEEHLEGHIPGSIHIDYLENNFPDGTFRPVNHLRIIYLEEGIDYEKEVLLYCETSIRGAQSYLAMYNAGYRNLRLYDGAWVEWSANPMNQVHVPESDTPLRAPDQS
ncbi:MAG: sulfurtransferase [Spirochaetaceae bacterium]